MFVAKVGRDGKVGWMERKGEGPNVHHTNYTAFISEYSGVIDEECIHQKNDNN